MALQVISGSSVGTGARANLGVTDDLYIGESATVASTDGSTTIVGTGSYHNLDIRGSVIGQTRAIQIGDLDNYAQTLTIGENAYVAGMADAEAVVTVRGNGNLIENHGTIRGISNGLSVGGNDASTTTTITNSGLITAPGVGIGRYSGAVDMIHLVNTGEIRAASPLGHSYASGAVQAFDWIANNGIMTGDILLGGGGDLYDGRGGGRVAGIVLGGAGGDALYGGSVSDIFYGDQGGDELLGGDGDDTLYGGDDADWLYGDAGNDWVDGGAGTDELSGGDGADTLIGGSDYDVLVGGAGDDRLDGGAGTDQLSGSDGNDTLIGGSDHDVLVGGAGDDRMIGYAGPDWMYGGTGSDVYFVDDAGDHVDEVGGGGADLVQATVSFSLADAAHAQGAVEQLALLGNAAINGTGNAFANVITGNGAANVLDGLAGNDTLIGGTGDDTLIGDVGNDMLDADAGSDTLVGALGGDVLDGGADADSMLGGLGNDTYFVDNLGDIASEVGGDGVDLVNTTINFSLSDAVHAKGAIEQLTLTGNAAVNGTGNALANIITGNTAANALDGGAGNDRLIGLAGNDTLVGGPGNDVLFGDAGVDTLRGGLGRDTLTGGAERDNFVFDTGPSSANRDTLINFTHGLDKLQLDNAVFAKLGAAGALKAGFFHAGTAAHDANDFIVYNRATGALSYDRDGDGALPAVQLGLLTNKPVLTAIDFAVI